MSDKPAEPTRLSRIRGTGQSLRHVTARGAIVTSVFNLSVYGLSFLKTLIVAAFLTTSQYGVWGILVISLGALASLKDVGVDDKFVQQDEPDQEVAFQKAFTMGALLNAAYLVVVLAAIPLVALVYGHSEIVAPALALTLSIPAAVLHAPVWIFYREMNWVKQRLLQAVDPLVSFVVTVALAIAGAGYWSLVAGVLAGAWCAGIAAVIASPYRLAWRFERGTARDYVHFSRPLVVMTLATLALSQLYLLVANHELGLAGAGIIAFAAGIALYADRVDTIVTETIYPAICAVRDRADLLLEAFVKSNRIALMWGMPFGIGVALFASDVVHFVVGDHWEPAIGLLRAWGIIAAVNHIGFNWSAFYRARAETRPIRNVAIIGLVTFGAVAWPLTAAHGIDGFAAAIAILTAVTLAARFYYLSRLFPGLHIALHCLRAIAPTVPAAAITLALRAAWPGSRTLAMAIVELVVYVVATIGFTWLFERSLLREVVGYLRRQDAPEPAPVA